MVVTLKTMDTMKAEYGDGGYYAETPRFNFMHAMERDVPKDRKIEVVEHHAYKNCYHWNGWVIVPEMIITNNLRRT